MNPSESDSTSFPQRLGRYEIKAEIGRGGFGAVFRGHDVDLDRQVAIKVPRAFESKAEADEFLSEAKRLAQLQHQGIVSVYDVGEQDGICYIVTELIEGKSLQSELKSRTFSWQDACRCVAEIADALAHAHAKSMIHRDIKPGNIMIRRDRSPVILDFGLALTDLEATGPTGAMLGTPAYMAPEQVRGEAHRVDGRTDIYSLGVVLYQMLAGRIPFRAKDTYEVLRRILEEEPQPLRQLAPNVPPAVESACSRAMAKSMTNRFMAASDFAAALRMATGDQPSLGETTELPALSSSDPASQQTGDYAKGTASSGTDDPLLQPTIDDTPAVGHASTIRRVREAVRRRITVAVIGFEGRSADDSPFDAEQEYELAREIRELASEVVEQFGGVTIIGGGQDTVACFGYPQAYEDAAQRSIRAMRKLFERTAEWQANQPSNEKSIVEMWSVVHTGDAVVEDGGGESTETISLTGEAVNTAQKLASIAEPGTVQVTNAARQLAGRAFSYGDAQSHRIRGLSTPIELQAVIEESVVANRVELVDPGNLTPLIGRDTEVSILKDRWEQAAEGMGQVVLLIGEAGLGKSRLIREIRDHVNAEFTDEEPIVIELRCSAYHQNTGFFPLVEYFNRLLDFQQDTPMATRWERLKGNLGEFGMREPQDLALFATLVGVEIPADQEPLKIPPQRLKDSTQDLLLKWLRLQAEQRPVLFIVEDLHWADPTGLDVLRRHVEEFEADSILTLLTFRPEFQTPWRSLAHQTQIALNRLTKRQISNMLQRIEGRKLPDQIVQQVINRTDGVPLFVEEFAKLIDESLAKSGGDDEESIADTVAIKVIPASLQDLLAARLDRINSNLEVAQMAATIGREFRYDLLLAVAEIPADELHQEIEKLTAAEILFQKGEIPDAQLIFKHALIQDSAYQSMLSKRRSEFHLRIANVLQSQFAEVAASQPELLAQHYSAGGDAKQAVQYWRNAGFQALKASTFDEAIRSLRNGIEELAGLPESPERDALELEFQVPLAITIMTSKGYAHPELNAVHARARELCESLGGSAPLFHVIWGIWAVQLILDEMDAAKELCDELLAIAESKDDDSLRMEAWFTVAITCFYRGEFKECRRACESCAELEDREACQAHSMHTGQNAGMAYRCYYALSDWYLGAPDTAIARMNETIEFARGIDHPFSLAYALHHSGWLHTHIRNGEHVLKTGEECVCLANEQGFAFWSALGNVDLGTGRMVAGKAGEGLPYVEQGLEAYLATGSLKSLAEYYGFLGEIHLREGQLEAANNELQKALDAANQSNNRCYEAELLRLRGDVQKASGDSVAAKQSYLESLEVARRQEAKSWELRTTISLARLLSEQTDTAEPHRRLADVYKRFEEGFDTPDLQDARALLEQLTR